MKLANMIILNCLLIVTTSHAEILNVPADFDTIQEAIDAAEQADSIMVAEGVYEENIDFGNANVYLIGNPEDPSETIIDGGEDDCVIKITGGQSDIAMVNGFTLRNGSADGRGGGGIYISNNSRPILENLVITNCSGDRGGGIYINASSPHLTNISLIENTAQSHGGGLYILGRAGPIITDAIISYNRAETGDGGGISSNSSSNVRIRGGLISDNRAGRRGGGVYSSGQQIALSGITIRDNILDGEANVRRNGGGIYANGHIILADVVVIGNESPEKGGGIYLNGVRPSFNNVTIVANVCGELGGGIYLTGDVAGNCSPDLFSVTIAMNSADEGGGIYCHDDGNPNLENSIVWDNEPEQIVFSADGDENTLEFWYCDIQDGIDGMVLNDNADVDVGEGNIDEDPLFVNPEELDFHLSWENFPEDDESKSPCIDAGDPGAEDPDGTRRDMGSHYFHQAYPAIEVDPPDRLDFGEARPAVQDSVNRPINIINSGDARLFGELRIVAEDDPFIIQRQNMAFTVQPGSEIIVVITFKPDIRGDSVGELHITHNDPDRDDIVIELHGVGVNSEPEIISEIDTVNILEDSDWTFVADLSEIFEDPDEDDIEYVIVEIDLINLEVRDNINLFLMPDPDFNGSDIEIEIVARDEFDGSAEVSFALNILPLNDPPGAFTLESPQDDFTVNFSRITFDWETAAQNRWELDDVSYSLNFYYDGDREFSILIYDSRYQGLNTYDILDSLELTSGDMPVTIQWDVDAIDDSSTVRSEQRWSLVLDVLSVRQPEDALPTVLTLYPSFPNPFNSTTKIRYAVPISSEIDLVIYNNSGAIVDRLATGIKQQGFHVVQWNAENIPAGFYVISLWNGQVNLTQKVTLIK